MSSLIINKACLNTPSFGGLLFFLGIQTLLGFAFEADQPARLHWKVQAGLPAGLNLYYNLPTVHPQGQSGYAHKAVARLLDASRFCVLKKTWPLARGSDT